MTATRITVDNITYRVLVEYDSLKRSFELMEGDNTGVAISGRSIRDILGTNYKYSMTVRADPNFPSDYDAFYWKISEPIDYHHIMIPCGGFEYSISMWERGAISSSTGENTSNTSTTRIRTTAYLDEIVKSILPLQGYGYAIAVYDAENTYQGMWTGTRLKTSVTWLTTETNLSSIGNYNFRLVLRKTGDLTITLTDATNLLLDIGAISFDAKILSGEDVYKGYMYNRKYWDQLEVTFEPMEPQRK